MKQKTDKIQSSAIYKTDFGGLSLAEIRTAVADYMFSEGCSCCRGSNHDEHGDRLAKMLKVRRYPDKSGYDWNKYRSKQ